MDYSKIIEQDSHSALVYRNRGMCYYGMKNLDSALADFDKVMQLSPNDETIAGLRKHIRELIKPPPLIPSWRDKFFATIAIPLNMKIKNFLRQMIVTFNVNLALANSRNCYIITPSTINPNMFFKNFVYA